MGAESAPSPPVPEDQTKLGLNRVNLDDLNMEINPSLKAELHIFYFIIIIIIILAGPY